MNNFEIKESYFSTEVAFIDSQGRVSYGTWGKALILNEIVVGFIGDDPQYSWGLQMDNSYIPARIHQLDA